MKNWFSIKIKQQAVNKEREISSTKGGKTTLCPNFEELPQILIILFSYSWSKYICRKGQSVLITGSTLVCCCWVSKSCPTLCDPCIVTPPHSAVQGIFQARVLEWVAISHINNIPICVCVSLTVFFHYDFIDIFLFCLQTIYPFNFSLRG